MDDIHLGTPSIPTNVTPESNEEWKSCCLKMDKNAVKYFIQVGVLISIIVSSASMLVIEPDCNSQRNYAGLLTLSLGIFLPQPKMN